MLDIREEKELRMLEKVELAPKVYYAKETLLTWRNRIKRLETKMNVLAPDLVMLSFLLHEKALEILKSKVIK